MSTQPTSGTCRVLSCMINLSILYYQFKYQLSKHYSFSDYSSLCKRYYLILLFKKKSLAEIVKLMHDAYIIDANWLESARTMSDFDFYLFLSYKYAVNFLPSENALCQRKIVESANRFTSISSVMGHAFTSQSLLWTFFHRQ